MFAYEGTEILVQRDKEVQMAVHEFGEGDVYKRQFQRHGMKCGN